MKRNLKKLVLLALIFCLAFSLQGCKRYNYQNSAQDQSIDLKSEFSMATPEEQGLDSTLLNEADQYIKDYHQRIRSFIVLRNGKLVYEKYYNDCDANSLAEIHSVTKSVISALVGIAIEQGVFTSEEQPIAEILGEYLPEDANSYFKEVTLRDLMTMSSGIPWDKLNTNIGLFIQRLKLSDKDGGSFNVVFQLQELKKPGEEFYYSSLSPRFLDGILSKAAGKSDLDFLKENLFDPMGIQNFYWPLDDQLNLGGQDLFLRARDLAKLGQLYLDGGVWQGKQLVPKEWIKKSTKIQKMGEAVDVDPPDKLGYGYYWWISDFNGYNTFFAYGKYGQYVFVIPELEIVTVITSNEKDLDDNYRPILSDYVIPSVINIEE